ncbi:MAG: ABC transporter permease [Gemmataceae bacterium]|nr:ABC transporter permease [Gemmataceae bacterium]
MNAPAAFLAIRWLVWDTFRQAQASAIFWAMLAVSGVAIVFCASASTHKLPAKPADEVAERVPVGTVDPRKLEGSGVDAIKGEVRFLFGAVKVEWRKHRDDAVRWVQMLLAGGLADTLGVLLALIWTAAFLPGFLEPSSATVLLAKPVPRWSLLAGKVAGVLILVAFQAVVFVLGTWLALGFAMGAWDARYLLAAPLLVLHFAVFFSFSCMLAVWSRSAIVCIFGSLAFWFVCWGMNYGRHAHAVYLASDPDVARGLAGGLELGYWLLPKPADLNYLLSLALGAEDFFPLNETMAKASPDLGLSVAASVVFAVVMVGIAGYELEQADY